MNMTNQKLTQHAACECGTSRFKVDGVPLARFKCHCTICQSLYRQPFADVVMLWGSSVELPSEQPFTFKKYRLPPALKRATCNVCGMPVVGLLRVAPFLQLAFIRAENFPEQHALPSPAAHIFYHSRVVDVDDSLPKISHYLPSELTVTKLLFGLRP